MHCAKEGVGVSRVSFFLYKICLVVNVCRDNNNNNNKRLFLQNGNRYIRSYILHGIRVRRGNNNVGSDRGRQAGGEREGEREGEGRSGRERREMREREERERDEREREGAEEREREREREGEREEIVSESAVPC